MRRSLSLVVLGLLHGCGGRLARESLADTSIADASGVEASIAEASSIAPLLISPCPGVSDPPRTLECTGLYSDFAAKQLSNAVSSFAPAVPLWSDGAVKSRWVYLPPGTTIDTSVPTEWVFPVGTRFWKEFVVGGKRIETRLFQKVQSGSGGWVTATYAWNADESATTRSAGGDVPLAGGGTWHIPTSPECDKCHGGRTDRILGFEQGLLGLAGAQGLTLERLAAQGRLSQVPSLVNLQIGDDGTHRAAPALGWLHVNCGVTCHNTNAGALAYSAGMNLRLDPTILDGRSLAGFDGIVTSVGVPAVTPAWNGAVRIVSGDPASSLLVQLISHRGPGMQMPPIATNIVDDADVAKVVAWVSSMPASARATLTDAGTDAAIDASVDVQVDDVAVVEAAVGEAAVADAAVADAAVADAASDAARTVANDAAPPGAEP